MSIPGLGKRYTARKVLWIYHDIRALDPGHLVHMEIGLYLLRDVYQLTSVHVRQHVRLGAHGIAWKIMTVLRTGTTKVSMIQLDICQPLHTLQQFDRRHHHLEKSNIPLTPSCYI
jgi:hypothetical protein